MKSKTIVLVCFIVFLVLSGIYAFFESKKEDEALKNNVLVIATIKTMYNSRGPEIIKVQFTYNNEVINGSFGTYQWDSLAVNDKVRILISKEYPKKYIKYIGVAK